MQFDPRTVAREIPGIFDEVFPQLTPGIVAHLNAMAEALPVQPVRKELLLQSALQRAMLFELGYTVGEQLLRGTADVDWVACLAETVRRQRAYFDAKLPERLGAVDQALAETVGRNLASSITSLSVSIGHSIVFRPSIPGLEWISSGYGDFALGDTLVEVKCTAKRFSSADYRQIGIYWLLSFAASVEGHGEAWRNFILLNPRSGETVTMSFDFFLSIVGSGRTKVDILQLFLSLVGSRLTR